MNNNIHTVTHILCRLGITANYAGFHYTAYAVMLAVEDPSRLQLVTKWLYPEVAARYGTNADNVRKCIAKVRDIAWDNDPELLSEMAMHKLKKKPGTSEFPAIIALYIFTDHST